MNRKIIKKLFLGFFLVFSTEDGAFSNYGSWTTSRLNFQKGDKSISYRKADTSFTREAFNKLKNEKLWELISTGVPGRNLLVVKKDDESYSYIYDLFEADKDLLDRVGGLETGCFPFKDIFDVLYPDGAKDKRNTYKENRSALLDFLDKLEQYALSFSGNEVAQGAITEIQKLKEKTKEEIFLRLKCKNNISKILHTEYLAVYDLKNNYGIADFSPFVWISHYDSCESCEALLAETAKGLTQPQINYGGFGAFKDGVGCSIDRDNNLNSHYKKHRLSKHFK